MRAEAWLSLAVLAFFLLFIVTFNGWHGGWAVGPRYLVPAVPFLALPAVLAFQRAPVLASAVAAVSIALNLLVTAVDPQSPLGSARLAVVEGRPQWSYDHVAEYEWPLFAHGRAGPSLLPSGRSAFEGPVSANPIGIYEGWMFRVFPPGSPQVRMNSFNAGELVFPGSRWSLVPLLLLEALLLGLALRIARRTREGCPLP
jgi:hypothetical protein